MRSGELWVIRETPDRIGRLGPYGTLAPASDMSQRHQPRLC